MTHPLLFKSFRFQGSPPWKVANQKDAPFAG
jgi:hypothetical protein